MSYIDNNLLPNEQILFRTKKHFIIFFIPVVWTILALIAAMYMYDNPILSKLYWLPWIIAVVFWGYAWLEYQFSDFAVTDKRIMMREGFFTRHTNEMRIATISQVNVEQTLVGQLLNYGTVSINAFGAYDVYTLIAKPTQFQRMVNARIDKVQGG